MNDKANTETVQIKEQAGKYKKCSYCGKVKRLSDFNKQSGTKDNLCRVCKSCRSEIRKRSTTKLKAKIDTLKDGRFCLACGIRDPKYLDWHHVAPCLKSFSIGQMRNEGRTFEAIRHETAKCITLCANHHRDFHSLNISLEEYLGRYNERARTAK